MSGELNVEAITVEYENILLTAIDDWQHNIESEELSDCIAVVEFCKIHILPKYKLHLDDEWRVKPSDHEMIIKIFFEKF